MNYGIVMDRWEGNVACLGKEMHTIILVEKSEGRRQFRRHRNRCNE